MITEDPQWGPDGNIERIDIRDVYPIDDAAVEAFERQTLPEGIHGPFEFNVYRVSPRYPQLAFHTWWVDVPAGTCYQD